MNERIKVLNLYKNILRLSKSWRAIEPANDTLERNYIKSEARMLFRKNKNLTDQDSIKECIREAEARLELAVHYKIPYPRPVHLPPKSLSLRKDGKEMKKQAKMKQLSKPIYIKSQD